MGTKTCTMCNIEKHINNFYKNIRNAETVTVHEDLNATMKIKTKYQINKKYITKKIMKKQYYKHKTINVYNLET